jgi:hypothetical protein
VAARHQLREKATALHRTALQPKKGLAAKKLAAAAAAAAAQPSPSEAPRWDNSAPITLSKSGQVSAVSPVLRPKTHPPIPSALAPG